MNARAWGLALVLLTLWGTAPIPAGAGVPLGGLAVAVTPDGKHLVAGGDSRALYVLDPASLAVQARVPLGRAIVDLAFAPDGSALVVESTKAVQVLDTATWKVRATLERRERMSVAPAAGLFAVLSQQPAQVQLFSLADGTPRGAVPYDRRQSLAAMGLSPDGQRVAWITSRHADTSEPKVGWKDLPKDLHGAALDEFKQKHDGYVSTLHVVEVAGAGNVLEKTLWYACSGGSRLFWRGADLVVVGYDNADARIAPDGTVTWFELGNSYNYGHAASADGSVILSGGLRSGTRTKTDGLEATPFRLEKLPGFPEYWKSFTLATDGTGWGATSCWRVVRLDASGRIVKVAPVY
jgi:hypothetical protein